MPRNLRDRGVEWSVHDGVLQRTVTSRDGRTYVHRCSRQVFEEVCFYIEEHPKQGLTMNTIADAIDAPYTQVNITLELLKERGILDVRGRRSYMAMDCVHLHGMTEFLALAEGVPPQI